jgi:hypothetical protein
MDTAYSPRIGRLAAGAVLLTAVMSGMTTPRAQTAYPQSVPGAGPDTGPPYSTETDTGRAQAQSPEPPGLDPSQPQYTGSSDADAGIPPGPTDGADEDGADVGAAQAGAVQDAQQPLAADGPDPADANLAPVAVSAEPPPPLPVYAQPAAPGDGYIWIPGYWARNAYGFYWVPGTWVLAPYVGALWTPGYWSYAGNVYRWSPGYWGPHIGYYGGIDYGFGYIGIGYVGGYWKDRHFYYNRAITRVDPVRVRYVYHHPSNAAYRHGPRVSYYGGPGGLRRGPDARERAAQRERHAPPLRVQTDLDRQAGRQREQFLSVNRGRPVHAAFTHPAGSRDAWREPGHGAGPSGAGVDRHGRPDGAWPGRDAQLQHMRTQRRELDQQRESQERLAATQRQRMHERADRPQGDNPAGLRQGGPQFQAQAQTPRLPLTSPSQAAQPQRQQQFQQQLQQQQLRQQQQLQQQQLQRNLDQQQYQQRSLQPPQAPVVPQTQFQQQLRQQQLQQQQQQLQQQQAEQQQRFQQQQFQQRQQQESQQRQLQQRQQFQDQQQQQFQQRQQFQQQQQQQFQQRQQFQQQQQQRFQQQQQYQRQQQQQYQQRQQFQQQQQRQQQFQRQQSQQQQRQQFQHQQVRQQQMGQQQRRQAQMWQQQSAPQRQIEQQHREAQRQVAREHQSRQQQVRQIQAQRQQVQQRQAQARQRGPIREAQR